MQPASADETTRRLLFGASQPAPDASTPRASLAATSSLPPHAPTGTSAEEEAEAALRYLEAEWAMRMEAPLSALAVLEDSLSRSIDAAAAHLPYVPPEADL